MVVFAAQYELGFTYPSAPLTNSHAPSTLWLAREAAVLKKELIERLLQRIRICAGFSIATRTSPDGKRSVPRTLRDIGRD
jgi:hypothetical protein